jgi:hypothetical protein
MYRGNPPKGELKRIVDDNITITFGIWGREDTVVFELLDKTC